MKSLIFLLTTISIFSSCTIAQSQFIENGGAGAQIFVETTTTDLGSSIGGGLGLSVKGFVDIGFSIAKVKSDDNKIEKEVGGVHTNVFIYKNNFNFSVNLGFLSGADSKGALVGCSLGKNFEISANLQLQPTSSFGLFLPLENDKTMNYSSFGISLDFLINKHIIVSPNLGSANKNMFGGILIGYLIRD